jgi:hypothetical protein
MENESSRRKPDSSAPGMTNSASIARSLGKVQVLTFALNWFPAFHAAAIVAAGVAGGIWRWYVGLSAALFVLYLAPPLTARALSGFFRTEETVIGADSKGFLRWWALSCLQGVFNRFAFLEELLRIVPTVYSNWLRLWGAEIGKLAFWAPGVIILDRTRLSIGNEVLFGAGVNIAPHLMARGRDGKMVLLLDTVRIGDSVSIGGYSFLGPGTKIAPGETTRAFFISPPFSSWEGGKRTKVSVAGWEP